MQQAALIWITAILKKHNIPFQITGGLAARAYGATRPLADIDLDIPEDQFAIIMPDVQQFITYGPAQFKSDKWDLYLMTLDYHGQLIDLSGAYYTHIFNHHTEKWQKLTEDLSKALIHDVMGIQLPVIPKHALIAYKLALARMEDIMDVNEIKSMSSP